MIRDKENGLSGSARPTICRICKGNCGLLVTRNGQGVEISGNPEHPISKGFICFRAKNFGEAHSSPETLRRPLLRKGSGWVELSFEDALDILTSNLSESKKQYGPQSVVFYKGEPLKHQEIVQYMRHLAYGFGTPNFISCSSLCHESIAMGHGLTYGGIPGPGFESMKVALIWGGNPLVSHACMSGALKKAVRNGTKLVVIDPSRTQTAELAHLHLPISVDESASCKSRKSGKMMVASGWDPMYGKSPIHFAAELHRAAFIKTLDLS